MRVKTVINIKGCLDSNLPKDITGRGVLLDREKGYWPSYGGL
jgi:hypothetical protein